MAIEDDASKPQPWPLWGWPSWMMNALGSSVSALAPQSLSQPILPGWSFGNLITVTETNSNSPEMERDIVAQESYGRQLGRVIDALEVLVHERPESAAKHPALDDFLSLSQKINEIKSRSSASRIERIKADLARLKKDSPDDYHRIASALALEAKKNR